MKLMMRDSGINKMSKLLLSQLRTLLNFFSFLINSRAIQRRDFVIFSMVTKTLLSFSSPDILKLNSDGRSLSLRRHYTLSPAAAIERSSVQKMRKKCAKIRKNAQKCAKDAQNC